MQPYFIPYGGYFRLFSSTDLFVVYDCVQFPRRGWIHRNRLLNHAGELEWVTLPLQKQPMDTVIQNLNFRDFAITDWNNQLNRYTAIHQIKIKYPQLYEAICTVSSTPVSYLVKCLKVICAILDIPCNIAYSSELALPHELKGQDRILQLVSHFGASHYINAPGGRELYEEEQFKKQGIKLDFLSEYKAGYCSIVQLLADWDLQAVRSSII